MPTTIWPDDLTLAGSLAASAASYGFTLGGAVGLAMIEAGEPLEQAYLDGATWEVEIAGTSYPATASLRPLYDPAMSRVKS